jgi:MshEN domain/GAF domain
MKPSTPPRTKLGELLERRGHIDRETLLKALRLQRSAAGRIGTCLVELEAVGEDDLIYVLSDQLKTPFTAPEDLRSLPAEIVKLLPEKVARKRCAVPVRASSTQLTVAMRDPHDLAALDELAFVTGRRIRPQVATELRIVEALAKYYGFEAPQRFIKLFDKLNRSRFLWARDDGKSEQQPQVVDLPLLEIPRPAPADPASSPAPVAPSFSSLAGGYTQRADAQPASPSQLGPIGVPALAAPPIPVSPFVRPPEPVLPPAAPAPPPSHTPAGPPAAIEPPRPAASSVVALSLDEAEQQLLQPSGRDEIGEVLLAFARPRVSGMLLLMVRRDEAVGWMGAGEGLDDEAIQACRVDLEQPSFVRALRDGAAVHRGPLSQLPEHAEIRALLSTNSADDLIALPLRVRDRLVGVLVATSEAGTFPAATVEELNRLTAKASVALELVILRQKLQHA